MSAHDVVGFQLWIRHLRIALRRRIAQLLELMLLGRQRQAHDLAVTKADYDLPHALAERFLGARRAHSHRAYEPRFDVAVAVANGDVFQYVDWVTNVRAIRGIGYRETACANGRGLNIE